MHTCTAKGGCMRLLQVYIYGLCTAVSADITRSGNTPYGETYDVGCMMQVYIRQMEMHFRA